MNKPFISLITPVFRIEKLIANTIKSAIDQSYTDWEMILVDDGSLDLSGSICDEYACIDDRLLVIHKSNEGLAAARNTGIKQCNGQYFMIYEGSDILFDNNTLKDINDDINKNNDIDIYFARLQDLMEKDWIVTGVQDKYCVNGLYDKGGKQLFITLYDNQDILALSSPVNKAFKTSFIVDNELWFYKGIYHDDDEWLPRTIALSNKSYFTDRIIYNALTYDGCFGQMISDQSLTRKACDKMLIAEHCIKDIDNRFNETNTSFKKKYYEYYVRMYIDGIVSLNKAKDKQCIEKINNSIREHKDVFKYMNRCESKNLSLLYSISVVIGLNLVVQLIMKRYE